MCERRPETDTGLGEGLSPGRSPSLSLHHSILQGRLPPASVVPMPFQEAGQPLLPSCHPVPWPEGASAVNT